MGFFSYIFIKMYIFFIYTGAILRMINELIDFTYNFQYKMYLFLLFWGDI